MRLHPLSLARFAAPRLPTRANGTPIDADPGGLTRASAFYATVLLTLINVVNYIDRMILAVLVQPIKVDLGLSDSQIGLVSGFAFVAIYAAIGLPLAWVADRVGRRWVLAGCVAIWSICCAACGGAHSFAQLALGRLGVGVGEAGGMPSSHALLADIYPQGHRAVPIAVVTAGAAAGIALGLALGGWAAAAYGWRAAFMIVGLPGMLVALLVLLTLPEPLRVGVDRVAPPFRESLRVLFSIRTYRWITLAHPCYLFSTAGILSWLPAFYMRSHEMGLRQTGSFFGLAYGSGVAVGCVLGAYVLQAITKHDAARSLFFSGWLAFASFPLFVGALISPGIGASLTLITLFGCFIGGASSALVAGQQGVIPGSTRAVASALSMFISSYLGAGLGPLLIGIGSELLTPRLGVNALRAVLLVASSAILLSGGCLIQASRSFEDEARS